MIIHIEATHAAGDTSLRQDITQKLEHLGKKYPVILQAKITLRNEKSDEQKGCEMTALLSIPGKTIFAGERASDFRTALDKILQDLDQQLRKNKEWMQEKR